jgi:hypothetical protein
MPDRVPIARYDGPGHILADVNEAWRAVFVGDPPIGVPAREAFVGGRWSQFCDAMDDAWDYAEVRYYPCPDHDSTVVIVPLLERGRLVALATGCGLERIAPMPGATAPDAAAPLPMEPAPAPATRR